MARLVTIGDSLTQGFQSGAISRAHLSWPALLARAMGLSQEQFSTPNFEGRGGLPVNLEALFRGLHAAFGSNINPFELVVAPAWVQNWLDDVEDYWERGPGRRPANTGPIHHNLSVWGFTVGDAHGVTDDVARRNLVDTSDELLRQVPDNALYRTVRRTLNPRALPSLANESQLALARRVAQEDGGIDNLVFWLGANHALGTVLDLEVRDSEPSDLARLPHERRSNLWRPEHFDAIYRRVADRVDAIGARFVFVGTIPHVTIPPVTRGVSLGAPERDADGYYEFYTRFWVWDDDFKRNPEAYQRLSRAKAKRIDATIDAYNATITSVAAARGWHVIDFAGMLGELAFRRNAGLPGYVFPTALAQALRATPGLRYLAPKAGGVTLDTRYLRLGGNGRIASGGLFSLDGVHPTTIGYGLIAHTAALAMNRVWAAAGSPEAPLALDATWWSRVLLADSLLVNPPGNLDSLRDLLSFLAGRGLLRDLLQALLGQALR